MTKLEQCRIDIDQIDKEIVRLYEERMNVAKRVAEVKQETHGKVLDPEREQRKLTEVSEMASCEFHKIGIRDLFTQIMSLSRKYQYSLLKRPYDGILFHKIGQIPNNIDTKVVYFGEEASFSEQAMEDCFGVGVCRFSKPTFREVMLSIQSDDADYGVLPIENSTTGGINDIYDLLVEFDHYIVKEHILRVEQSLLGLPGAVLEQIQTVYSHPQAILQSKNFLEHHPAIRAVEGDSTSGCAKRILEEQDITKAAIASKRAAVHYGLSVLAEHINYENLNSTRFIVISKRPQYLALADRISIYFTLPHKMGSLYHILSHINCNALNMTRIESRPLPNCPFEYRFFVDFEGNLEDPAVQNVLDGLKEETLQLKILGNFMAG